MKERTAIKMWTMILLLGVLMDYTSSSCPGNCPDAPYHIVEPSADNDVQIVSPTATYLNLRCSLNVTIPAGIMITWSLNGDVLQTFTTTQAHTVTDTIQLNLGGAPQSGVYQCLFNDPDGYILSGNITVLVIDIVQPSMDYYTITFGESTRPIQLMCSLNINISSNVMVTWLHNRTINVTSPDDVTQAGNAATLVIRNPQPSDAGIYQCVFNDSVDGWTLKRNIGLSPYHIVQPSTDNFMQTVFETATNATLRCSLNINIPASMTITWMLDGIALSSSDTTQNDQTTILRLRSPPQDGVYQCIFNDTVGYILRRSITLVVVDIVRPSGYSVNVVTFDNSESSVQLMCSLNINIPSNVTVTWLHNSRVVMTTEHDENSITTTTTLVIRNPQSNDYMCVFADIVNGWTLSRDIVLLELSVATTATKSMFDPISTSTGSTIAAVTPAGITTTHTTSITSSTSTFTTSTSTLTISPYTTDGTDKTSSSSDINAGVIVAPIIIIIVITLIVVALIIAFYWWRRKKQLYHNNEAMLQKSSGKQEPVYSEIINGQDSKEPQYMEIITKQAGSVAMQDNPAYSITSEHQVKMEISKSVDPTKQVDKVMMQDNPAYSATSDCPIKMQDNPAYSVSQVTKQ